jgi:hypothetical protein
LRLTRGTASPSLALTAWSLRNGTRANLIQQFLRLTKNFRRRGGYVTVFPGGGGHLAPFASPIDFAILPQIQAEELGNPKASWKFRPGVFLRGSLRCPDKGWAMVQLGVYSLS